MGAITDMIENPEFIRDTVNDVYAVAGKNVEEGKTLPALFFRAGDCDTALYRAVLAEKELREMGYETIHRRFPESARNF